VGGAGERHRAVLAGLERDLDVADEGRVQGSAAAAGKAAFHGAIEGDSDGTALRWNRLRDDPHVGLAGRAGPQQIAAEGHGRRTALGEPFTGDDDTIAGGGPLRLQPVDDQEL